MTTLETLQSHFQQYMLTATSTIRAEVATPFRGSATTRLSVYGEGYYLRLLEALSIEFNALKNFLGEPLFNKMGVAFLDSHPSNTYAVRFIGTRLPEFLASYEAKRPYIRELALFEVNLSNALDAADAPIKTTQDLAAIPVEHWGEMKFKLHPSVALLDFEWDIPALWQTAVKKVRKKPTQRKTCVTIWRKQLAPYYFSKDESETRMLLQLQAGEDFAALCQSLVPQFSEADAAQQAINTLVRWLNEEMISDIHL